MASKISWLKKLLFVSFFITGITLVTSSLRANDFDLDDDLGDISFEQLEQFERDNNIDSSFRTIDPGTAGMLLSMITEPLWKNTKAPAGRDVLYLLPYKITAVEYGGFAFSYFYNMTPQMAVTVNDLFSLPEGKAFDDLLITLLPPGAGPQEIMQLLPLFQKITLQDHKSGLLLQSGFIKGPFTVQIHTSLQVSARNFWLNTQDQKTIRDAFANIYGDGEEIPEKEFYKIRVGLGDTRLKFGLNTINMTSFQNDIGFEAIIPTSRFFYSPNIAIGIAQADLAADSEDLQDSALATLRAIRDYILNPPLGNGGHFGLGCYVESKIGLFHELAQLWVRASYDVLFPSDEDRLFMFKQVLTPDDIKTGATQELISQYIQQYIFPSSFKSSVYPGGVVNFVAALSADYTKRIKGVIGYDFYAKGHENIRQLLNTSIDANDLLIDNAQGLHVSQHKIFTEFLYHNKREKRDVGIGVGGDVTVAAKNIGEDWTVYLKVSSSF